jgi:hypothetical protein
MLVGVGLLWMLAWLLVGIAHIHGLPLHDDDIA